MYGIPVPVLQQVIGSRHFAELSAHYDMQPPWYKRLEYYLALLTYEVYQLRRQNAKDMPNLPLDDFMLKFGYDEPEPKRQSTKQMKKILNAWVAVSGKHQQNQHQPSPVNESV